MRKFTFGLFIYCLFSFVCSAQTSYKIFSTKDGSDIPLDTLVARSQNYDVIFFGEFHDDTLIHQAEIDYLTSFYKTEKQIGVSMEMFERDVQIYMNRYFSNIITEKVFLDSSRPWPPSYSFFYRPIVEFARTNKLFLIAANVPRKYASLYSTSGMTAINSLSANERALIAKNININNGPYKYAFYDEMLNGMYASWGITRYQDTGKLSLTRQKTLRFSYGAQIIKDETMAESIYNYRIANPGIKKVIHYNGSFHSNYHWGTAEKLHDRDTSLKILVISPAYGDYFDTTYQTQGDYILMVGNFPLTSKNTRTLNEEKIIIQNPVKDKIEISSNLKIESFKVLNLIGQTVESGKLILDKIIDFSNQPNGVYILQLKTTKYTISKKIIKE